MKKFSILSKVSPVEGAMLHHKFVAMYILNGSFSPPDYTLACTKRKIVGLSCDHKFVSRPSNLPFSCPLLYQHYSKNRDRGSSGCKINT